MSLGEDTGDRDVAVLLPGGALVCDDQGEIRFGLSESAFEALDEAAPDILRLAVAHLAARHAHDVGLAPAPDASGENPNGTWAESGVSEEPVHRSTGAPPGLEILPAGGYLDERLLTEALRLRRAGRTALPAVRTGGVTYVGPLLGPEKGPCIACVRRAVLPNRQTEPLLASPDPRGPNAEVLAHRARAVAISHRRTLWAHSLELDPDGRVAVGHPLRTFPDCPVCGGEVPDPNLRPPTLASRPKHPRADTGSRVSSAEQAYETLRHLVSPLTGAVRHVREVRVGAPGLIHVYTASHAVGLRSESLRDFMRDRRDHSGGKGGSAAQARVSALCEALERFSSVFRGNEVDATGSAIALAPALDPRKIMLFSERQYRTREEWNTRVRSRFQRVPEPFDPAAEVAWSRVWCLRTREAAFVPTALLYHGFRGPGARFCKAHSNGLAAGQTLEEAILQGFLEVVERDAIAIWWYNRTRQPEIDVESFEDPYVDRVLAHYREIGRDAWVLDLTSDLGIPVFAAVSALNGADAPEVIFGFGAHLDPAIALRRCVTEMNQMLATAIRPPDRRSAQLGGAFDDVLRWWSEARLEDHPYLVPCPQAGSRGRECFHHEPTDDLLDDLGECLNVAGRHGLSVFVRDMTRADLGISVAKVLVPGLRHFWRRLGPGRLYDVPVATGRVSRALKEEEMNPVSLFV